MSPKKSFALSSLLCLAACSSQPDNASLPVDPNPSNVSLPKTIDGITFDAAIQCAGAAKSLAKQYNMNHAAHRAFSNAELGEIQRRTMAGVLNRKSDTLSPGEAYNLIEETIGIYNRQNPKHARDYLREHCGAFIVR